MNNKGESRRGRGGEEEDLRSSFTHYFFEARRHRRRVSYSCTRNDYTMSGFGKFSTIRYRFRRAILSIRRVTFNSPPPSAPFYFAIFARIHRTMPRNKTRPPLIRITAKNPRNCTVAPVSPEREKMVLKSVSGISFRFTILPPILLASLIHRCPLPYRYSRSVNQSSKPERFRNCIFLRIPRDARPDLFPSSLETLRSRSWRERLELLPRK